MKYILGISAYYHDSAVSLVSEEGEILVGVQEERFSRKKHDQRFPVKSIEYCIDTYQLNPENCEAVVFYEKPLVKFERLLETYLTYAPNGFQSFLAAMPIWLKEKLFLKSTIKKELASIFQCKEKNLPPLLFNSHHGSHAASAFYPSPFEKAAVLCMDGVGEWATSSVWLGDGNKLIPQFEIDFPHSIGLLYSAFTYYTGFKVNSGEYKVMGLAPYGEPEFVDLILKHLIDLKEDGSFRLDMSYFNYATGLTMTNEKFDKLFGAPPRKPESTLTQREMNLARSIQDVTEKVMILLSRNIQSKTGMKHLCMAGGVALNCVANGKILKEKIFEDIWVQPAAGDAGGALGAALSYVYEYKSRPRKVQKLDSMKGSYIGPSYSVSQIKKMIPEDSIYEEHNTVELTKKLAKIIADGNVVGLFQGKMEFGPRSLGCRSIIGDARNTKMQSVMNLKIKYRESFRPFAPAVLSEDVSEFFDYPKGKSSPYMLMVAPVHENVKIPMSEEQNKLFGIEKLNIPKSTIPAITHIDYSARIQTVHRETNPFFYDLIFEFKKLTGTSVIVNTSFNVRGEPIVSSPMDAFTCFMRTEMDYLVLENLLFDKKLQKIIPKDESWKNEFELD
jgi:carbamoyltransferase